MQGLTNAVSIGLENYLNFEGRARRADFWWWFLATILACVVASFVGGVLGIANLLTSLLSLALFLPNLTFAVRRFHDIGMSGWWVLISLIPILGFLALIYFFIKPSDGPNQYGPIPDGAATGL